MPSGIFARLQAPSLSWFKQSGKPPRPATALPAQPGLVLEPASPASDGNDRRRWMGQEKLGYLGLGLMGFPMTLRLLKAGHDVTVWNRSPGKAAGLIEAGAKLAATPREVAAAAGIVFM